MPDDQNQNNSQNQTSQDQVVNPPQPEDSIPFPVNDLPPLSDSDSPVENQVAANAPQMPGTPPPFDIPPVVTPLTKKPWSGGKFVGAVLGVLLLVGGVTAGILLVQQQQDIREKAAGIGGACSVNGVSGTCTPSSDCAQSNDWSANSGSCQSQVGMPTIGCCRPKQAQTNTCNGQCFNAPGGCVSIGRGDGTGTCSGGQVCCSATTPTPSPINNCTGQCFNAPGGCVSIGRNNASGTCTGGQACCSAPTPTPASCNGTCEATSCQNLGKVPGSGACSGGLICCAQPTPTPTSASNTCSTNGGSCFSAAGGCVSIGRSSVNGTCTGGQVCCSNAVGGGTPTPTPGGGGATITPSPTPNSSTACRYVNDGNTVTLAGNCTGYTFRALVFQCASQLVGGKCEGSGSTIIHDQPNATSVNINMGTVPACGSRQADLIVTSRPNDGLSGDELPGTPRVANFISKNLGSAACGPTSASPSPATPTASCQQVLAYDTNWNRLSSSQLSSLRAGDKVRFTITGSKSTGSFSKARFKINSGTPVEVTTKKPGEAEVFYTEYTIPTGTTTFTINAAIYHSSLGWIPNNLER